MFMKAMRSKPVRLVLYTVLGAFGLYNGASCLVTLYKAGNQPYLLSGTERFDFMGYQLSHDGRDAWRYLYCSCRHSHSSRQMDTENRIKSGVSLTANY